MTVQPKRNEIQVLETNDYLYYVIIGKPEVIKEKALKRAEEIKRLLKWDGLSVTNVKEF